MTFDGQDDDGRYRGALPSPWMIAAITENRRLVSESIMARLQRELSPPQLEVLRRKLGYTLG